MEACHQRNPPVSLTSYKYSVFQNTQIEDFNSPILKCRSDNGGNLTTQRIVAPALPSSHLYYRVELNSSLLLLLVCQL